MVIDEKRLDGQHLIVKFSLLDKNTTVSSQALINCGASVFTDSISIESGDIMCITEINCKIGNHSENLLSFVTKLGNYQLVLEISRLRHHDETLLFDLDSVLFHSSRYYKECREKQKKIQ